MAEVAALELRIGADIDGVVKGLDVYEQSLIDIQDNLKTFSAAQTTAYDPKQILAYGKQIQKLKQQEQERLQLIQKVNTVQSEAALGSNRAAVAINNTSSSLRQMNKSSSNATNSLFALSGVVQDAPYGFRAISNNITFFTQQMAYSVKASGGFKTALKELGSAFLGPAGIIFAVSAATSLLTAWLGPIGQAKDKTKDAADAVKTLSSSLLQGSQNAQKNAVNLGILYKAAINTSKSTKERTAAVKALQDQYPTYFGNLKQETILTGKAGDAYENLKNQIIATARAKAAEESIIANEKQRLAIEQKLPELAKKRNEVEAKLNPILKAAAINLKTNAAGYNVNAEAAATYTLKLNSLNNKINQTVDKYNALTKANQKLSESVNVGDLTTKIGGGGAIPPKTKNAPKESQSILVKRAAFNVNNALAATRASFVQFTQQASASVSGTLVPAIGEVTKQVTTLSPLVDNVNLKFVALADSMSSGLTDAFQNVFQAIAGGGNPFQALINSVKQLIVELAAAAAVAAILAALTGGGSSLGAGITKLFGGGSFTKIFGGLTGIPFASGGIAYGPTRALVGEYSGARSNPEVIAPLDKLKGILAGSGSNTKYPTEIRLVAQGGDLVGVFNMQMSKNNRRG